MFLLQIWDDQATASLKYCDEYPLDIDIFCDIAGKINPNPFKFNGVVLKTALNYLLLSILAIIVILRHVRYLISISIGPIGVGLGETGPNLLCDKHFQILWSIFRRFRKKKQFLWFFVVK